MISHFALGLALVAAPTLSQVQGPDLDLSTPAPTEADELLGLTIDEAVERGLRTNFRVQRTNRNEDIAKQRINVSRAQLRPRFDLGVTAGQNQTYFNF
jgi:outer membrane protein TolC